MNDNAQSNLATEELASLSAWLPSPLFGIRAWFFLLVLGSLNGAVIALLGSWFSTLNGMLALWGFNLACSIFLLLPRHLALSEKGLQMWWLKSSRLRFDEIRSASASRATFGDYLQLTLTSGQTLSIQTRTRLLPTWFISATASSAAAAFPVELVARVIQRRSDLASGQKPGESARMTTQ